MYIERTVSLMAMHYCAQPAGHLAGEEIQDPRLDHKGSSYQLFYLLFAYELAWPLKKRSIISNETPVILIA